jgi:tryptophan-rich sensory protein
MNARRWIFATAPVAAAAGLGGLGARHAPQIYGRLQKPRWAPPASVFGPVWSALYAGIGVVGWRLSGGSSRRSRSLHLA